MFLYQICNVEHIGIVSFSFMCLLFSTITVEKDMTLPCREQYSAVYERETQKSDFCCNIFDKNNYNREREQQFKGKRYRQNLYNQYDKHTRPLSQRSLIQCCSQSRIAHSTVWLVHLPYPYLLREQIRLHRLYTNDIKVDGQ